MCVYHHPCVHSCCLNLVVTSGVSGTRAVRIAQTNKERALEHSCSEFELPFIVVPTVVPHPAYCHLEPSGIMGLRISAGTNLGQHL